MGKCWYSCMPLNLDNNWRWGVSFTTGESYPIPIKQVRTLFILVTKFWLRCEGLCKFIYKQGIQLSATFRMGSTQGILQNEISENWKKTSTTHAHRTIPILTDILLNDLLCNIVATKLQILVYLTNFLEYNYTFCCYLCHEHATVSCCMEILMFFYHLIMFNLVSYVFF
jgi:hypothetical protein